MGDKPQLKAVPGGLSASGYGKGGSSRSAVEEPLRSAAKSGRTIAEFPVPSELRPAAVSRTKTLMGGTPELQRVASALNQQHPTVARVDKAACETAPMSRGFSAQTGKSPGERMDREHTVTGYPPGEASHVSLALDRLLDMTPPQYWHHGFHALVALCRQLGTQSTLPDSIDLSQVVICQQGSVLIAGSAKGALPTMSAFCAPEVRDGHPAGEASLVYSLTAILYRVATGLLPIDNSIPSRIQPELPPWVDATCVRGLAKEPAARFSSVKELLGELQHHMLKADQQILPLILGAWVRRSVRLSLPAEDRLALDLGNVLALASAGRHSSASGTRRWWWLVLALILASLGSGGLLLLRHI